MSRPSTTKLTVVSEHPHKPRFDAWLKSQGLPLLRRAAVETLQVNVGKRCNQACHHCHVQAGPKRTESMSQRVAERVIELLEHNPSLKTLDLTGGAPELNRNFRLLVTEARRLGREVIDRCNLTILHEPGMEDLASFLAEERVHIVASLPCYEAANVDTQRGRGVFDKSIQALRALNALGYGSSGLTLDLVYNPVGASLPPEQRQLEATYKQQLAQRFGVEFDRLLTITNMPIERFAHMLGRSDAHEAYMSLLVNHFNPQTLDSVMCRSLLSVGWDGRLYDCDFNQMLDLPLGADVRDVWEIEALDDLRKTQVATGSHCFGCTAGAGSSCGGALE